MSLWWFEQLTDLVPNHVISTDVPSEVAGRAMICRRLEMFPVECVARGYLTGSGLTEYERTGSVSGRPAAGARRRSRLPSRSSRRPRRPRWATTTRTCRSRPSWRLWARRAPGAARLTLAVYAPAEQIARSSAASCSRTPSSSSARSTTARSCSPTRCSLPTRRGSGPPTSGSRVTRSRVRQAVRPRLADLAGVRLGPPLREPPPALPHDVVPPRAPVRRGLRAPHRGLPWWL